MRYMHLKGFTLLEILLAMMLFSIMSLSVYQVLQGVLRNVEIARQKSIQLRTIQRAMRLLDRDITHAIIRPFKNIETSRKPDFSAGKNQLISEGIELIRNNRFNPGGIFFRSELERVGYRLRNGVLERINYRYPDNLPTMLPTITPIIKNVTKFKLLFFQNGQWKDEWVAIDTLPKGIDITLDIEGVGVIQRIFMLTAIESTL